MPTRTSSPTGCTDSRSNWHAERVELLDPDAVTAPAFGLAEDVPAMDTGWHRHARPQLLYAVAGAMRLETRDHVATLPPDRAAWVPAGAEHRVRTGRPMQLRTVYFAAAPRPADDALTVFRAPALLREMAVLACRWGVAPPGDETSEAFFRAMRGLVEGWRIEHGEALVLPAPRSEALARALDALLERLGAPVGPEDAARAGAMSVRTLQRRMRDELGTSFSTWLARARMLRATELLADPDAAVGDVALRCGFQSPAAFSRAFQLHLGRPPSAWRRG